MADYQQKTPSDPAALVQRWYDEVWNKGNERAIDELYADDGVSFGLGRPRKGKGDIKRFFEAFRANEEEKETAIRVVDTLVSGDRVAFQCEATCTYKKSRRQTTFSGGGIARVRDGKFVEVWNVWDFFSLAQQVGEDGEKRLRQALHK
jgi:uncharacterized protein (TIGR02246 family)